MENFNQLIPIDEGKGKKRTMTSLQIAEITGKTHSNVMRDIRNILEQLEDLNYHQDLNLCQTVEAKKCLVTFSPKRIAFFSQVVMMQTYEPKLLIVGKNLKKTSVSFPVKGRNLC